jgi:hypothetical protein
MRTRNFPGAVITKKITASHTLSIKDLKSYDLIEAQGSGITLTLPTPSGAFSSWGIDVVNTDTNAANTVTISGSFVGGGSSVTLAVKDTVTVMCVRLGDNSFKWLCKGATPA